MFSFVIKYLGFLKLIPGVAQVFDTGLKIYTFVSKPILLDWMDSIAAEVSQWPGVKTGTHKYGGIQFNYGKKEIGHMHGNGLLDMLLSKHIKHRLMPDGRILDHHSFKNTGWINFYIHTAEDKDYALQLLKIGYYRLTFNTFAGASLRAGSAMA